MKAMDLTKIVRFLISLVMLLILQAAGAEEYVYQHQGKRDPFVPLVTSTGYLVNLEPTDDKKLSVEGIMYDTKGNSMAIVNGELVRVGDTVGAAVVTAIEAEKVVVLQDNQNIELELRREE